MNDLTIRKMEYRDIRSVVEVHLTSFDNFFLSSLGHNFLYLLYKSILEDKSGIALVYENQSLICGFIAGTDKPAGFYKRLIAKKLLLFAVASVPSAIKNPLIIPRLFRSLQMPSKVNINKNAGSLMSLAVRPDTQGHGIGKSLVEEFLRNCSSRNLELVNLTTDAKDNVKVNTFYKNLGFKFMTSFTTPEGREMNEYEIKLPL